MFRIFERKIGLSIIDLNLIRDLSNVRLTSVLQSPMTFFMLPSDSNDASSYQTFWVLQGQQSHLTWIQISQMRKSVHLAQTLEPDTIET